MELLNEVAVGDNVNIYNILGPILLTVLIFGAVLLHRPRSRPVTRSGTFTSRVRAAVAAGYLTKEEGAEIIARHRPAPDARDR